MDCLFQDLLKIIRQFCGMLLRAVCRFQTGKAFFFERSFIAVQTPQGDPVSGCDVFPHLELFCRIKRIFQQWRDQSIALQGFSITPFAIFCYIHSHDSSFERNLPYLTGDSKTKPVQGENRIMGQENHRSHR